MVKDVLSKRTYTWVPRAENAQRDDEKLKRG